MKVLGISGSPRRGKTTDRLVWEVLNACGGEVEFISLAGKNISPCRACLACVKDNICKLRDDMNGLREKLVEADGLVLGAPNYFSMLNGLTHCFLERLGQFRHRSGRILADKPAVVLGIGGLQPDLPARQMETILGYYGIRPIGSVTAQGPAACFTCGYGERCEVGAVHMLYGPGTTITGDLIPDLSKQPEKVEEARALGKKLKEEIN